MSNIGIREQHPVLRQIQESMQVPMKDEYFQRKESGIYWEAPKEIEDSFHKTYWYKRKTELAHTKTGRPVVVLTEQSAKRSMFAQIMKTDKDKKENEEEYRRMVYRQGVSLAPNMEYPEVFKELVIQKFEKRDAQEKYNRIIEKAEIFHNLESRGTLSIPALVDAAIELNSSCDNFFKEYAGKEYQEARGKISVERVYIINLLANNTEAYNLIKQKYPNEEQLFKQFLCHGWSLQSKKTSKKTIEAATSYVMKDDDPKQRIARMRDTIRCFIDAWTPHDLAGNPSEIHTLAKSLKEKVKTDGNLDCLLKMVYPDHEYQAMEYVGIERNDGNNDRDEVKEKEIRSNHTFIMQTDAREFKPKQVKSLLTRVLNGLDQTFGDVVFWGIQDKIKKSNLRGNLQKNRIGEIKLTGSDLHERGLGVCLVTYVPGGFYALKPDRREFEYATMRTTEAGTPEEEKSLVERINTIIEKKDSYTSHTIEGFKPLKTLKMFMVGRDGIVGEEHGTLVEGIEDLRQIFRMYYGEKIVLPDEKVSKKENNTAALVAGLLGIGDLHGQNVFYTKEKGVFRTVLGDIDVLEYSLWKKYSEVCKDIEKAHTGFLEFTSSSIDTMVTKLTPETMTELEKLAQESLSKEKRRLVPLSTEGHQVLRDNVLDALAKGLDIVGVLKELETLIGRDTISVEVWGRIKQTYKELDSIFEKIETLTERFKQKMPDGQYECTLKDRFVILKCALEDYSKGTIPFYEYNPQIGHITTHDGSIIVASRVPPQVTSTTDSEEIDQDHKKGGQSKHRRQGKRKRVKKGED